MDELDLDGLGPGPFDSKGHYGSSSVPGVDDDDFLPQHHPEDDDPFGLLSGQYELNPDEYLLNQATGGGDGNGVWNSAADDDPFGGPSTSVHSDNQNIEDHSGLFTDNDHLMASTANFGNQEDEEFEASNSPLKRSQRASVSMMNSGGDYHLSVKQEPAEDEDELNTAVALQNENTPAEASSSSAALNNDNNSTETRSKTSARDQPENTSSSTISTTTTTTTTTTSDPKEKAPSRGTFWDYECTVCGRGFKRRVALEQHQQTAHGYGEAEDDPTSHLASGRSARIAAAAAAYEASSHHNSSGSGGATSFRSSVPSTSTPTTPTTTTGRSQPFQCPHCRKVIRSRGALTNHIRSHQRRAFACGRCDAFFGDAVELQTHIDRAHPSERHGSFSGAQQLESVSPSKMAFRGNATSASATSGDLESSCRYCGENFAGRPEVLIEHVRVVHHSGALCECPHCGQQVKNKYRLEEHITRRHSNYRPHRCDFEGCQRAFVTNTELKVHNRVHTGERPYVCAMCGFGFTVHSNLVKHMKKQHRVDFAAPRGGSRSGGQTFMGGARGQVTATPPSTAISTVSAAAQAASAAMKAQIKNFTRSLPPDRRSGPVKCPQCPAVIRSKYSLEDHMKRRHSNIRPHRCNHCPRRFVSASELVIHTRVHTGERPFSCEICNAGFTTKSSLVKHCRCMHGKDIRSFMKGGGKGRFGQRVPLPVQSASSSNSAEQRSNRSTSVQHFPRRHFGNELRLSSSAYSSSQEHQNSQHQQQSSSFQHSPPPPLQQQQQQQPIILNQYGEEEIPVDVKPAIFFCPYCPRGFTAQYNHTVHLRSHPEYQEEMRRKRRSDADDLNGGDGGDQEPQGQGQGPQGLQGQQGRQVQPEGGNGFRNNNGGSGGGGGGGGGGGSGNNRSGHQCDHCSMSFILQQDLMRHQQLTHRYHPGSKGGSANDNDLLADDDDEEEEDYVHLEPQVSFNEGGEEEGGDGENGADHGLEDDHHQNEDQFDDQGHQQLQNEIEDSQPDDTQDQQQQQEEDEEKEEEKERPSQPADPDRPFQCHECPRRFGDEAALEEHQVTHLFTVSYSCRVCGQAMEGKEELVSHMKVHYGPGGSKKGPIPVQVSTDSSAKPRQQSSSSSSGGQPSPSPSTGTRSPAPIISQQQPLVSSNPAIRIRIVNGSSGVNATSTITSSPSTLNASSEPSKRPLPQSLSQHFSQQQQRTSSQQTSTSSTSSSSNSSPSSQRDQLVGPNSSTSSEGLRQKVPHQCPVCKRYFDKKGSLTNHLKAHQNESLAEQMRSQPKIAINGGGGGDNGGNGGDGGGGDDYDSLPMLGEKMGPRVGLNALGQLDRSVSKLGYACTLCEKSFHHASTLKTHLLFSHNIVEGSGSGSSAASAAAAAANGMAKRNGNGSGSSAYAARTQQQQQQRSFGNRGNSLMVNGVGSRQPQMQNSGRPTSLGSSVRGDGYQQQQQQQQRQSLLTSSSSSVRANGFGGQQQQQYQQRSSRPTNVTINGRPTASSTSSSSSALTPYSNIRRASLLHTPPPAPPPSSSQVNGEGKATPFQCQLCNRAFTAQRYLTNHVKSHRNETIRAEDLEEVPEVVEEEEVEEVQQGEDAPQEEEEVVVDNAAGLFQQNGFYEVEGGGEDGGGEEGGDDDDDGLEILNGLDVNLEGDDLPSNLWLDEDDDDQDFGGGGGGDDGYQQQHQPLQTMMEGEGGDDFEELHDEEEQLMDTGNMAAEGENGGGEEGIEEENPYQEQEFHDDDGMADQQNGDLGGEGGGWEEHEGGEGLDADYGGDDQFNGGGGGDDGVENGEEDDFEELPPADSSPSSASFNGRLNTGNAHLNRIFQSNVFSKERDRDPSGALPKDSHPCPHCKKAFSSRANLVIHIRIHTGERPYRCADCRVAFTSSSHFYRHQRSAAHARVVSGAQPSTRWQY